LTCKDSSHSFLHRHCCLPRHQSPSEPRTSCHGCAGGLRQPAAFSRASGSESRSRVATCCRGLFWKRGTLAPCCASVKDRLQAEGQGEGCSHNQSSPPMLSPGAGTSADLALCAPACGGGMPCIPPLQQPPPESHHTCASKFPRCLLVLFPSPRSSLRCRCPNGRPECFAQRSFPVYQSRQRAGAR